MNQKILKNKKFPVIVKTIAIIDILIGFVMIYMLAVSITALYSWYNNPEYASNFFEIFGSSWSSQISLAIKIFVVMVLTFVFAIGLLKNKDWAIKGRILLAVILSLNAIYLAFLGETSLNVIFYYNLFVIVCLGWIKFKKR